MPAIPRKGKPVQFSLEYEALEILRHMAANRRSQGILLSTLLRQEEARRIEARRLRHKLAAVVDEALTD
jgi:hypothetical protein